MLVSRNIGLREGSYSGVQTRRQRNLTGYSFMTPWLLGMIFLTAGSMLFSLFLAFTRFTLLAPPHWIGAANFNQILHDSDFWISIRATLIYVGLSVPARLVVALLVALLLSKQVVGISIYRALIYLPSLIGGSVGVSIGWRKLFAQHGPVNSFLALFGIHGPIWTGNPSTAMFVIVLLTVWQFGSEMVIFLAGLKQIPIHLYESATIDGASSLQQFFRVTLPMLSPIVFFNLFMGVVNSFMVFTQVFIITDGGPIESTMVYVLYLYQEGFRYFHMGYAAALSMVLLILIGAISAVLFATSRFWVYYDE